MAEIKKDPLVSFVEATQPKVETPATSETPATPEVPATPAPEVKVETPKVPEVKIETPASTELIDLDIPEATPTATPEAFDFPSLVKDLGFEVKTKEELVEKVKSIKTPEDPYKGLPDNLRKAVDFAKQGGDFLQLLKVSQVDYSQIDPTVLYEQQILNGTQDKVKAKEYLDSLSPLAKEFEGQKLKNQMIQWQESAEKQLLDELNAKTAQELAKRAENEQRLRETVNKVDSVEGFKVKQGDKDRFIREVLDGSLTKELFMDNKGQFDYEKMMRVRFLTKNFDAIQKHYGERIKNATKREIVEGLTNADVQTQSVKPEGAPQVYTNPLDAWMAVDRGTKK